MTAFRAIVVGPDHTLVLTEADAPSPTPQEAVIEVAATSLNRGETRRAKTVAQPGTRPGWDVAGTVVIPAANGGGPKAGARVVGVLPAQGGWARRVAVPVTALAVLPDAVTFAQAACLPVAGLTALHALSRRGDLTGRRVLITGATGGVGHFACQLAAIAGAHVVAAIRSEAQTELVKGYGAHEVALTGTDSTAIKGHGPFDLIVESVGGASLEAAMAALAPGGVCVTVGVSSGSRVSFDAEAFFYSSAALSGMVLFRELQTREPAGEGLARLLRLVAAGRLRPHIAQERPWTEIEAAARDLLDRAGPGKIVLHIGD